MVTALIAFQLTPVLPYEPEIAPVQARQQDPILVRQTRI